MTPRACMLLAAMAISVAAPVAALGQARRDFFNRDVLLYNPIIDVVNSGSRLVVQPTVSRDMKYVTVSGQFQAAQVVRIESFPILQPGLGFVGGVRPAGPAAPAGPAGEGADDGGGPPMPLIIRPAPPRGILAQRGMTRLP